MLLSTSSTLVIWPSVKLAKNGGKAHVRDVVLNMQAVLEARTTAARLQLVLEALLKQRNRLQALAALRVAEDG